MSIVRRKCSAAMITRNRGAACSHPATALIAAEKPFYVCGHHARAYNPRVVYPMIWNLARVREWQMDNLETLLERSHAR